MGHDLGKACGLGGNALGEQFKIREVVTEVAGNAYAVLVCMG